MRTKHTFRLPPDLAGQLANYAGRKRVPQALVVETALSSYLSPDNSERMEAALGRTVFKSVAAACWPLRPGSRAPPSWRISF